MQIEWYGQSSFRLSGASHTVAIDPFGDMSAAASRGMEFNYPAITGLTADLLLVTHEHGTTTASRSSAAIPSSCAPPRARPRRRSARWSGSPPSTTRSRAPSAART